MMMKNKLCAALCALLLVVNLGSAEHDEGHAAAANSTESGGDETAPVAPDAGPVPVSNPDTVTHAAAEQSQSGPDTNSSSRVNSNSSGNTTTEEKNVSVTDETKKLNGTDIVAPTEAAGPEKNQTDQTPPQPTIPLSGTHAPASPTPLTSTTTTTTTSANPTAGASTTTKPPTNTSHPAGIPLPDSTAPTNTSSTTVPTPEPPKAETTASTTTTTTTTLATQSTTTSSSTSATQAPLSTESHTEMLTSLRPEEHPETSTVARQTSTVLPSSSPSAQAKSHANPSQLNDTTMVHNTPTLDPLLAGLVSAFIITAVIITLLLFLKLRRRDNRPEFRRLQDLPMDDMMEDTPLSMYSY